MGWTIAQQISLLEQAALIGEPVTGDLARDIANSLRCYQREQFSVMTLSADEGWNTVSEELIPDHWRPVVLPDD